MTTTEKKYVEKLIVKWNEKHSKLLSEYQSYSGLTENGALFLRSEMTIVLEFMDDISALKSDIKEEQPSDEDIKNAASDYVGYKDDKDTLPIRYLSREQYALKAYIQGATDFKNNNIYISK